MNEHDPSSTDDPRLQEILADYLRAIEAGTPADEQSLILANPDLAEELQSFFRNRAAMSKFANAAIDATVDSGNASGGAVQITNPRVRYFGDYELLEEIARGGMGVVYKARQVNLNRTVALKMILAGQFAGEEDVKRFRAEAEAAARLDHPGIVPIYEVGQHQGQHYYSMGFVAGQSLAARIAEAPLPAREAAELMAGVSEAVHYAHQCGVIHRDLKPANVLLDLDGRPRVTDFGLAKRVDSDSGMTATGQVMGTPSYMPPEQAAGRVKDIRPASDVYALGAVLYAMLSGRPPFQAATSLDTLRQVLEQEPVALRQLNAQVPRDLETIAAKCLEKSPARRYAAADDLGRELRRFLAGEPIAARSVTRWERGWRWVRRHPARAGMLGACALAVVLLVALGVGWSYQRTLETTNVELASAKSALQTANRKLEGSLAGEKTARASEAKAKDELDQVLYFRRVMLAYAAWKNNDVAGAREILAECREPHRNWEWRYVSRLCDSELLTLKGHSVGFSPDGKWIATGRGRGSLTLWHANSGHEAFTLNGDNGPIQEPRGDNPGPSMAFSPDSKLIASRSHDNAITLWDLETQRKLHTLTGHTGMVVSVAFSPDGRRIASASQDGTVKIWDREARAAAFSFEIPHPRCVAFSADGKMLACVAMLGIGAKVWDVESGTELQAIGGAEGNSVAFTPNGKRIATGYGNATIVWDIASGNQVLTLRGGYVAFSPDGKRIATGIERGLVVALNTPIRDLDSEKKMATGIEGIKLWDSTSGNELFHIKGDQVWAVAFSPDGKRIAGVVGNNQVKVWDAVNRPESHTLTLTTRDTVCDLALSMDGRRLASAAADGTIKIWDAQTLQELRAINAQGSFGLRVGAVRLAISPDGKRLVSTSMDGFFFRLWDVETGRRLPFVKQDNSGICTVAFSPDGKRFAGGSVDGTIRVWDAETRWQLLALKGCCPAFSPGGRTIFGASATSPIITAWDSESGQQLFTLKTKRGGVFESIVFNGDGTRMVSGSGSGITVWDIRQRKEILTLKMGLSHLPMAFSPDGTRIALQGVVWDARNGHQALSLDVPLQGCGGMVFTRDGRRIIGGCPDGSIRIWDATPRESLLRDGAYRHSDALTVNSK